MEITVKHEMDNEERKTELDDAFMEALSLSEGRTCDIENKESDLKDYLEKYPEFIKSITDEYKFSVLKGWNYEVQI